MTDRIWVQVAGEDRRVPIEGQRGRYFEHGQKHQVRHTPFIERRIKEKDLVQVDAPTAEAAPAASGATPIPATVVPAATVVKAVAEQSAAIAGGATTPGAGSTPPASAASTEKGA
jgi:hypothetical protein